MASFVLPGPVRRIQPQTAVGLNRSSRFAKSVVAGFNFFPSGWRESEFVGGNAGAATGTPIYSCVDGVWQLTPNSGNYNYGNIGVLNLLGEVSFFGRVKTSNSASDGSIISKVTNNGATFSPFNFGVYVAGASDCRILINRAGGSYRVWTGSTNIKGLSRWIGASCAADISVTPTAYVDGVAEGSFTQPYAGAGTGAAVANALSVIVGNRADGASQFVGSFGPIFLFNRILTASEHLDLYLNPWQLFAPLPRRVYSFPATPIAYLLTVSATTAASASAVRAIAASKSASKAASASMVRSVSATRTTTQGGSAVVVRSIAAIRAASSNCGAVIARAITATKAAGASCAASLVRALAASKSASVTRSGLVVRSVSTVLVATSTCGVAIVRAITAIKAAGSACGATIVRSPAATKAAAQSVTGTFVRRITLTRDIAQSCAATAIRVIAANVIAGQASAAVIVRTIVKTLSDTRPASASIARSIGLVRAATQGCSGTIIRNTGIVVSAPQTSSAAITRSIGVVVSAITSILAALVRVVFVKPIVPGRACITVSRLGTAVSIAYASAAVSVRQGYAVANVSIETMSCA